MKEPWFGENKAMDAECRTWRIEVSSDVKMVLLASWQGPAYPTSDLTLDMAEEGSRLEIQER